MVFNIPCLRFVIREIRGLHLLFACHELYELDELFLTFRFCFV